MTLPLTKNASLNPTHNGRPLLPLLGWISLILAPLIATAAVILYALATYNHTYEAQAINHTTFKAGSGLTFADIVIGMIVLASGAACGLGGVIGLRSYLGKTNSTAMFSAFSFLFALFFVFSGMPSFAINASGSNHLATSFYVWLRTDHNLIVEPQRTSLFDISSVDGYPSPQVFANQPRIVKDTQGKKTVVTFKTDGDLITIDSISTINK